MRWSEAVRLVVGPKTKSAVPNPYGKQKLTALLWTTSGTATEIQVGRLHEVSDVTIQNRGTSRKPSDDDARTSVEHAEPSDAKNLRIWNFVRGSGIAERVSRP